MKFEMETVVPSMIRADMIDGGAREGIKQIESGMIRMRPGFIIRFSKIEKQLNSIPSMITECLDENQNVDQASFKKITGFSLIHLNNLEAFELAIYNEFISEYDAYIAREAVLSESSKIGASV